GRIEQASVHLDLTTGDPGAAGRLRQLTLGLSSRGLSFGYQRDVFDAGGRGHTYRIGYAAGRAGLAAGIAAALYRGDGASASGWDLGVVYDWMASLTVGGVIENVGRPSVRGTTLPITYVPSATLRLWDARAALSADGRFTSGGVLGYAFGLRATLAAATRHPVGVLARLDTDRTLARAGLAFGVSLGSQDLAGPHAEDHPGRESAAQVQPVARAHAVPGIHPRTVRGDDAHDPARHQQQRRVLRAARREHVQGHVARREGPLAPQHL